MSIVFLMTVQKHDQSKKRLEAFLTYHTFGKIIPDYYASHFTLHDDPTKPNM